MLPTPPYNHPTHNTTTDTTELQVNTPQGIFYLEVGYNTTETVDACTTDRGVQFLRQTTHQLEWVTPLWGDDEYTPEQLTWLFKYLNNNPHLWEPQP